MIALLSHQRRLVGLMIVKGPLLLRVRHWAFDAIKLVRRKIFVRRLNHILASEMDMVALSLLPRFALQSLVVLLVQELLSVQVEVSNLAAHLLLLLLARKSPVFDHSVRLGAHYIAIGLLYLFRLFFVNEFVDVVYALVVVLAVQLLVMAVNSSQGLVLLLLMMGLLL